jgi:hypothetical protein
MEPRSPLSPELHDLLALTVHTHLGDDAVDHDLAVLLCEDAVVFAREYGPDRIGPRARTAALLLLELAFPAKSPYLRRELAVACELTAIGAAARDRR